MQLNTKLQQYLPLAVLKPNGARRKIILVKTLQQYLPLAVLKPRIQTFAASIALVATVLTACGIETFS